MNGSRGISFDETMAETRGMYRRFNQTENLRKLDYNELIWLEEHDMWIIREILYIDLFT